MADDAYLPIPIEELPPEHLKPARTIAMLYVVADCNCDRCDTMTPLLRIEPIPDVVAVDVVEDIDCTMHLCPTCLEALAREVREKAPLFT